MRAAPVCCSLCKALGLSLEPSTVYYFPNFQPQHGLFNAAASQRAWPAEYVTVLKNKKVLVTQGEEQGTGCAFPRGNGD